MSDRGRRSDKESKRKRKGENDGASERDDIIL